MTECTQVPRRANAIFVFVFVDTCAMSPLYQQGLKPKRLQVRSSLRQISMQFIMDQVATVAWSQYPKSMKEKPNCQLEEIRCLHMVIVISQARVTLSRFSSLYIHQILSFSVSLHHGFSVYLYLCFNCICFSPFATSVSVPYYKLLRYKALTLDQWEHAQEV